MSAIMPSNQHLVIARFYHSHTSLNGWRSGDSHRHGGERSRAEAYDLPAVLHVGTIANRSEVVYDFRYALSRKYFLTQIIDDAA